MYVCDSVFYLRNASVTIFSTYISFDWKWSNPKEDKTELNVGRLTEVHKLKPLTLSPGTLNLVRLWFFTPIDVQKPNRDIFTVETNIFSP